VKKAIFMLKGGLGNQLFQLSSMLDVKLKTEYEVGYTTHSLIHDDLRSLDIGPLLRDAGFKEVEGSSLLKKSRFMYRAYKKFLRLFCSSYLVETGFSELNIPNILTRQMGRHKVVHIDGYFQSIAHVQRNLTRLRELLFENVTFNIESVRYESLIQQAGHTVSLHVRRGDYVSLKTANEHHGLCGSSYYIAAVEHVKSVLPSDQMNFFIFSDDIDWCKKNIDYLGLSGSDSVCFVERGVGADAFQDILLMSLCDWNILANSTYSWWGAVLGGRSPLGGQVAPKQWLANNDAGVKSLFSSCWVLK
jgi:hypothetical protein